jgi:tRNA (uracil-5-)-methyltransferase TRM9
MGTNSDSFDVIAPTWYGVRHWPLLPHELDTMAGRWREGRVLNAGCGTGADFLPFIGRFDLVGLDHSSGMLRQCRRYQDAHGFDAALIRGNLTHLPFADCSFDYAVGIACYHHLMQEPLRQLALRELKRILRPNGEAFLSVWNHAQPRFSGMPQDVVVPWRTGGAAVDRQYHLFTVNEFRTLLRECDWDIVQLAYGRRRENQAIEDRRNVCALVRRLPDEANSRWARWEEPG